MMRREISESDLRNIILRADRLAAAHSLTPQAVREIGIELGLHPAVVDAAITEFLQERDSQHSRHSFWPSGTFQVGVGATMAGIGCGLVLGVTRQVWGQDAMVTATVPAIVFMLTIGLLASRRVSGRWELAKYQVINLAAWTGFGLGLLPQYFRLDAAAAGAILGAIVGTIVMAVKSYIGRRGAASATGGTCTAPEDQAQPSPQWWRFRRRQSKMDRSTFQQLAAVPQGL